MYPLISPDRSQPLHGQPVRRSFSAGGRLDATGLYYYNARYYDPTIGRFITPDTVIQSRINPLCLNRYSYGLNNPLKSIDPSGHYMVDSDDGGDLVISNNSDSYVYVYNDFQASLISQTLANSLDETRSPTPILLLPNGSEIPLGERVTIGDHLFSNPDKYFSGRGWTEQQMRDTISHHYHTSPATDRTTPGYKENNATAYYRSNKPGDYVIVNNRQMEVKAAGDANDTTFKPDSSIKNPPPNRVSGTPDGYGGFYNFFPIPILPIGPVPVFPMPMPGPVPCPLPI
jgi:RHS repeat-associated protein